MIAFLVLLVIIAYVVVKVLQKSEAIGNWNHLFHDLQHDSELFYKQVENLLHERQISGFISRMVALKEGGLLSHTRVYLEISRGDYILHICAAPWGTGGLAPYKTGRIGGINLVTVNLGNHVQNTKTIQPGGEV